MNTDRIKEIQQETAFPDSVSVCQALLKVWNETEQEQLCIAAVIKSVCPKCGSTDLMWWFNHNTYKCHKCDHSW